MLTARPITDRDEWNALLRPLPYAHVLQTWEWGEFKRVTTGWIPTRYAFDQAGEIVAAAAVLTRRIGPLCVMYVPKGPALKYEDPAITRSVLDFLEKLARRRLAVWIKIDPDVTAATGLPPGVVDDDLAQPDIPYLPGQVVMHMLQDRGWRFSDDQVQFRNTFKLDLSHSEDALLAAMSQNTRRKVRTGEKKGVTLRAGTLADLPTLYALYRATGERDHFLTRPAAYYERAWRDFMQAGLAHALLAEADGEAIAAVILFHFGRTCWYFYGASADSQREKMPNYALQWEAMRWAKAQGCAVYDMWGAPDTFAETDPMWGVYQFKRGFRGSLVRHIGAWDYAPFPPLYTAYTRLWPRLLAFLRRRTQQR